ncbi:MAG: hypothetical protein ABIP77_05560 [Candidatus Limnocylindrales bacterium]
MADERATHGVGRMLSSWMADVAPDRAPERLFEEAFARTMAAPQRRALPWHRRYRQPVATDHRARGLALAGLAAVVVIAIGTSLLAPSRDDVGGGPTPSPLSSPSITPGPPSPSVSASRVPFPAAVIVEPTATIPISGPIAMATDGVSLWLFTTAGYLVRIDPRTNTIAATVRLDLATSDFQSLAGDATGLWVTDWTASQVLRFDPQTLRSVTSIGTADKSKGLLLTSGAVWIANTRGGSVERVDPATNTVVGRIPLGPVGPSGPNWLAQGLGSVWVGIPNNGTVARINEATNEIEATIEVPPPASPCGGLAVGTTAVWVTSCDGSRFVAQIDPITNTVVGTIDLGGNGYTFAMVADRPWISPTGGQIVRIDPVRHVVDRVVAPGAGFSGGGDVVVAAGSLWVIDGAAGRVLRLPISAFGG